MKTTAQWIDQAVNDLGITAYRLAKLLDCERGTVSNYRTGRAVLSEGHAIKLGELLAVDPMPIVASAAFERAKQEHIKSFWAKHAETLAAAGAAAVLTGSLLTAPMPVNAREAVRTTSHNASGYTLWQRKRRFKRAEVERRSGRRSMNITGRRPVFFRFGAGKSFP